MTKFSVTAGLYKEQAELDFLDVDTSTDNRFYLDPYAIQIRDDEWSMQCGDHIRSFFVALLDALRTGNNERAEHLLGNLHEPNETFLGQSKGTPQGKAIGSEKASWFANALVNSRAFETGVLSDISEAELFIYGVGPDTISDLTTNVVRGPLVKYTHEQCNLHGINVSPAIGIGPIWNPSSADWEAQRLELPHSNRKPVLLVPKFSVRYRLSLDSQEFWNHHMVEFLKNEYLQAGGALVQTLKDGTRYVTKKSVKQIHPFVKDDLADFVRQNPDILEAYKNIKGARGPLSTEELEEFFDECAFARALIQKLGTIPSGSQNASEYHSVIMGILTFIFYPDLIAPVKEHEIYNGRKRIDISFTNASEGTGFFHRMLVGRQTRALKIPVECKNYSTDINNPELDQLEGRFGHRRGFFGMLTCRNIDNRDRIINGCRDAASDREHYMIVMDDADIVAMLELIEDGTRSRIYQFLQNKFDLIIS